jgi:hypothetical protein
MLKYQSTEWGGDWVAEATLPNVRLIPAEKVEHNVKFRFLCKFDTAVVLPKLRTYIGDAYDYEGIGLLGWMFFWWRVFKIKIKEPYTKTKGIKCSEFLAIFFQAAGLPDVQNWDIEVQTPESLLTYCEDHSEYFSLVE